MKKNKFAYRVVCPAFLYLFVFLGIPIIMGLVISFFDYNPLSSSNQFVGLANFQKMFSDENFQIAFKNTFVFTFATVFLNIFLALVLATFISTFQSNKVRSFFRMVFFLPCIAPSVATSIVFGRSIYPTKTGLLNIVRKAFGLSSINWLGDPSKIMLSLILYSIWVDIGYNIILFSAGIDGIPKEMLEAAELDGAGNWKKFTKIIFPLLGRTFQFVVVQTLISHFQMFSQFAILVTKDPKRAGLVLSKYIYDQAFNYHNMGYASAISMILFLVILVISKIDQKATRVDWEY